MKSLIYTILLFANLALVSGCTIEDKESKDNIQKQQTTAKPQIAVEVRDLSIQTHFVGLNFNEYQVHISWPQVPGQIRISSQLQILAVVPAESGVFIHEGQKSAEKINYLLEHLTLDGRIVASIPVSVQTPKDLLLHGDWKLSKDETLEAQRVFLAKGTTITVFDKSFSILAQELISEGALIQSYAEGDQAAVGVHGRAGGTVTISAITARGDLVVQLKDSAAGTGSMGVAAVVVWGSVPVKMAPMVVSLATSIWPSKIVGHFI